VRVLAATLMVVLAGLLVACQEEANVNAPKVSDLAAERQRVSASVAKRKAQAEKRQAQKQSGESDAATAPGESILDTALGAVEADYVYDARDKRDPFRSTFWERKSVAKAHRGPLEQYELAQLAVTAIVWESNRPRALVRDPSGESYVIKEGSYVGKNEGLVIHIGDNLVLVKETYMDFAGDQSTKDVEMRIRKSEGG